jgi:hypothetical protein
LVINLISEEMLSWLNIDVTGGADSSIELLNAEGYWLHSVDPKNEWAFLYEKENSFARSYPEDWSQITANEFGQFRGTKGLVTFHTVRMPVKRSLSDVNYWKLVSRVTNQELNKALWMHRRPSWMISMTLLGLMALVSAGLATAIQRRRQAEEALRKSERKYREISSGSKALCVTSPSARRQRRSGKALLTLPTMQSGFWIKTSGCCGQTK